MSIDVLLNNVQIAFILIVISFFLIFNVGFGVISAQEAGNTTNDVDALTEKAYSSF